MSVLLSDAYVRAVCRACDYEEEIRLTPLAGRGEWDERSVADRLAREGWNEDGLCPDCVENAAEGARDA